MAASRAQDALLFAFPTFHSPDQITASPERASATQTQSRKQQHTSGEQRHSQDGKCCARARVPPGFSSQGCSNVEQGNSRFHSLTLQESIREVAVPTGGPLHRPSRKWTAQTVSDSARGSEMVAGMMAQGCKKSHSRLGITVSNPTSQQSPAAKPLNFSLSSGRQGWHPKKGKERSFDRRRS